MVDPKAGKGKGELVSEGLSENILSSSFYPGYPKQRKSGKRELGACSPRKDFNIPHSRPSLVRQSLIYALPDFIHADCIAIYSTSAMGKSHLRTKCKIFILTNV